MHWNTLASEGSSNVSDQLNTGTNGWHLTAVSENLNSGLIFGELVQQGLVEEVEDPCDRAPSPHHPFSQWWQSIIGEDLSDGATKQLQPVKLGNR